MSRRFTFMSGTGPFVSAGKPAIYPLDQVSDAKNYGMVRAPRYASLLWLVFAAVSQVRGRCFAPDRIALVDQFRLRVAPFAQAFGDDLD